MKNKKKKQINSTLKNIHVHVDHKTVYSDRDHHLISRSTASRNMNKKKHIKNLKYKILTIKL